MYNIPFDIVQVSTLKIKQRKEPQKYNVDELIKESTYEEPLKVLLIFEIQLGFAIFADFGPHDNKIVNQVPFLELATSFRIK